MSNECHTLYEYLISCEKRHVINVAVVVVKHELTITSACNYR